MLPAANRGRPQSHVKSIHRSSVLRSVQAASLPAFAAVGQPAHKHQKIDHSYGPLPVMSTYNPIYRMYNPTYNQL